MKNEITSKESQSPSRSDAVGVLPIFPKTTTWHNRSFFSRLVVAFLILSLAPITIYVILTTLVYWTSVIKFLPAVEAHTIQDVLFIEIGLIFFLAIMAVIFIASITANAVLKPIQRLLELTRLVGEGKLEYRLKVVTDDEIGELTDAFNAMVEKIQEQQSRERLIAQLKSEFISIAAHQLRTPLSAFKWTLRMIIDGDIGPISPQQEEFLERGYQVNEHMIKLVNDLLNAARIEEGRFGYTFAPTDFVEYMKQFVDRYKQQADSANMTVTFSPPELPIPLLNIDSGKIDIVVQNLLDNALKYSPPGGVIQISMGANGAFVETTVADNGVGIPKNQLNRVFTKFFRGDNVMRMETQGTGLGLFIVRNIVKNHGGDIRVESEENKGSKFVFTLPISKELIPAKEERFEEFLTNL